MSGLPKRGDTLAGFSTAEIHQSQVDAYLAVSGDRNPLHQDAELAAKAGLAGIPVPGMLMMAEVAKCVEAWPHCGRVENITVQFVSPALVGGDLQISARVLMVNADLGNVVLRATAGQAGKLVMIAEVQVRLAE